MQRQDSRSAPDRLRDRREQVAAAARHLASSGLVVGTARNVSARVEEADGFAGRTAVLGEGAAGG